MLLFLRFTLNQWTKFYLVLFIQLHHFITFLLILLYFLTPLSCMFVSSTHASFYVIFLFLSVNLEFPDIMSPGAPSCFTMSNRNHFAVVANPILTLIKYYSHHHFHLCLWSCCFSLIFFIFFNSHSFRPYASICAFSPPLTSISSFSQDCSIAARKNLADWKPKHYHTFSPLLSPQSVSPSSLSFNSSMSSCSKHKKGLWELFFFHRHPTISLLFPPSYLLTLSQAETGGSSSCCSQGEAGPGI